jgi:hypothetical protein
MMMEIKEWESTPELKITRIEGKRRTISSGDNYENDIDTHPREKRA